MQIREHVNLKPYNTFGIYSIAKYFVEIRNIDDLQALIDDSVFKENELLILGGGSNVLLTKDFDGLVVKNTILGREIVSETDEYVEVKIGGGEVWHDLVLWAIENNWGGIENLSLIPGTVGAAPMQNIGAYGVEIKDVFVELEGINLESGELEVFDNQRCEFGYRESVFKKEKKGNYTIVSVTLKLQKNPILNVSYGAIKSTLEERGIDIPTIKDVSDAVIAIRQSKLPDPMEIGNAGSFFKNPTVDKERFLEIKNKYNSVPGYELPGNKVKVPAGWLIEQCGWKGKTIGEIGVHKNQALVLVNYGDGRGSDLFKLSENILVSVNNEFGIKLTREVNII